MFIGENPIHIKTESKDDIAPLVLLPGDPMRAKYIAEHFLEDARLVTDVRGMFGYTGKYKGITITVMGSGMGMPSASIYVFELVHYYNVKKIIRIGTCGAVSRQAEIGDIVLASEVYSESNFAYTYNDYPDHIVKASEKLNHDIIEASKNIDLTLHVGMLTTMDVFGPYIGVDRVLNRTPKDLDILAEEMEAFGVIHVANSMGIDATAMATVVDSKFSNIVFTPEQRETTLNSMITLALEAIIK